MTESPRPAGKDDVELGSERDLLVPKKEFSRYQRFFKADLNADFARNVELAMRAAIFMTILSIPKVFDHFDIPGITGHYSIASVMFFMFVYDKTVGACMFNILCAMNGVLFSWLSIFIMFGFFPTGVTAAQEPHIIAYSFIHGATFVWLMLWLNFGLLTQIFSLCFFVWYWMSFLTPDSEQHHFGTGFKVSMTGTAMAAIFTAVVGSCFAFAGINLPYPMTSIQRARDSAQKLGEDIGKAWIDFGHYYCGRRESEFRQATAERDMKVLNATLESMDADLDVSYWECFGVGQRARSLALLDRARIILRQMFNRLTAIQRCLMVQGMDQKHHDIMTPMKPEVTSAIKEATDLLQVCIDAACDGSIQDNEAAGIKAASERTHAAVKSVTQKFKETNRSPKIDQDAYDERAFCVCVCQYCRLVFTLADELLADHDRSEPIRTKKGLKNVGAYMMSIFDKDVIFTRDTFMYALRNWLAIMIAFWIGYRSPKIPLLSEYNAAMASTVTIQLSRFIGSAVTKNLERLQGLVIGVVFGQIIYCAFGWCIWYYHIALLAVLFLWVFTGMYIYFEGRLGSIGILFAIFGASAMLGKCRDHNSNDLGRVKAYSSVVDCCVAISVMTLVDFVLARATAAQLAFKAYSDAWTGTLNVVKDLPLTEGENAKTRTHEGKLAGMIANAHTLGVEASQEPRYWRVPWLTDVFERACQSLFYFRVCLSSLEGVASTGLKAGSEKTDTFVKLCAQPEFVAMWNNLTGQMHMLEEKMIPIFVHDTEGRLKTLGDKQITKAFTNEQFKQELVNEFLRVYNKDDAGDIKAETLEEDPGSQVSAILTSLCGLSFELSQIRRGILAA